ncbi:MAG: FtsK/SpoIIIE domain-containing protein [Egibacteraceae bacterium]
MQIVIATDAVQQEFDLQVEDPTACVADLVGAAAPQAARAGVVIGGRYFRPDAGLDEIGLYEGAVVQITNAPLVPPAKPEGPALVVVGGPVAGGIYPFDGRAAVVGRSPDCDIVVEDPTLSQRHAELRRLADGTIAVTDLDSHNGTWADGVPVRQTATVRPGVLLRLGATHARIVADLPDDRPLTVDPLHRAAGGLVPFNRPPRPALSQPPPAIEAPEAPKERGRSLAFSVLSIAAPLVMGGVMIGITRRPEYALLMLLSPVMAVGNWIAARRQATKERTTSSRAFARALQDLESQLEHAALAEVARREELLPDMAETLRRVALPSTQLWQRRPGHGDFLHLRAGIGDVPWCPPVGGPSGRLSEEVAQVVARHAVLLRAPVAVDLSGGGVVGVVGVVGERTTALALARSLVLQAAAQHGPADLGIAVLVSEPHVQDWDWAKWLPHVRDPAGSTRMLAGDRATADELLTEMTEGSKPGARRAFERDGERSGRTRLLVLDDVSLVEGRRAPARLLLRGQAGPAAGIVIATTADQLPAVCTTVITMRSDLGDADLHRPQEGERVADFVICGVTEDRARQAARTLARYEDPELELAGAGLPQMVRLLPLLGMEAVDADAVLRVWAGQGVDPAPGAPIGMGEDGVVHLDLVRDGPHGLIGGTTGSGKSELLRSMVAGMAARVDPDHLVFVLVDYKGGSAFDECARLPHTVGMVTDLDEHLGERALRSLRAELSHRERLLRQAGASDLPEYLRAGSPLGPLPRLVVVIDEFATLATEMPDFIGALVGVAQRGRSLGVHLILATQRPAGVVSASIKANTNLRIALRVQDAADSTDIIDRTDAAAIKGSNPGRAYVRLGPTEVVLVQTALSTAARSSRRSAVVRLEPFRFGPVPSARPVHDEGDEAGPSDLAELVQAVRQAFDRSGIQAPREPWLPMLPERMPLEDLLVARRRSSSDAGTHLHPASRRCSSLTDDPVCALLAPCEAGAAAPQHSKDLCDRPLERRCDGTVPFALADDPERQRRVPVGWSPSEGHLALFGMVGAGTTTALLAVTVSLAERVSPDQCHLYAVDFGAGGLSPLAGLPHVGEVIGANEREQQFRLIRYLRGELDRRRELSAAQRDLQPRIVVLIDGVGAFLAEHDAAESADLSEGFRRVFSEGPGVGIVFVVTGDRPAALPLRLSSLVSQKILFRFADPGDFASVGMRPTQLPAFVPGRGIHVGSRLVLQVGDPGDDLRTVAKALRERYQVRRPPPGIGALPVVVPFGDLPGGARLETGRVELAVGIADADLGPAVLVLRSTDHALVAGPPYSGKSSALMLVASLLRAADPGFVLIGVCDERSPLWPLQALDAAGPLPDLAHVLRAGLADARRWFVLVDDAPLIDDEDGVLAAVLRPGRPGLHVIAAGRTDDLRGGYGHWTRHVRQARTGILLQPDLAADGEILGVRLPRRVSVPLVAGRGFVVNAADPSLAQIALPPEGACGQAS